MLLISSGMPSLKFISDLSTLTDHYTTIHLWPSFALRAHTITNQYRAVWSNSHLHIFIHIFIHLSIHLNIECWGTWVAQSVKHPTSAQVMISRFVSSSPTSGSVLTAWSLEPASVLCLLLSLSLPNLCSVFLCLSKNK